MKRYLMNTYDKLPITLVKGEGVWVWDDQDKQYMDAISGMAVTNLGHNHPVITSTIQKQSEQLIHCANQFNHPFQESLAAKLCEVSGMEQAFLCNSGAEANEAAIKLARLYGHQKGFDCPEIIVMENSFHGRTLATLSASGNRKVQAGFEPLTRGFLRVPFNDIESITQIAQSNNQVAAIFVESIQGDGGIRVPSNDYLEKLRAICDENQWLLITDEVQTAIGRTGEWFYYQNSSALPDVVTVAKGLGSGLPVGACLARNTAAHLFQPGHHGSTIGGNPLVSSVALAVLETIENDNLIANAQKQGRWLLDQLATECHGLSHVREVRGCGLMIGIELEQPATDLALLALQEGLLINITQERIIRLLPPLILSDEEAQQLVERCIRTLKKSIH